MLSKSVDVAENSAQVCDDFDNGRETDDHLPVICTICFAPLSSVGVTKVCKCCYDRACANDADEAHYFQNMIQQMQPVPFGMDPSSHAFLINGHLRSSLEEAFSRPKSLKKQPYVDKDTFYIIIKKVALMKTYRNIGRHIKWACAVVCLRYGHKDTVGYIKVRRWTCIVGPISMQVVKERTSLQKDVRSLSREINTRLSNQFAQYLDGLSENLKHAALDSNASEMFRIIRRMTSQNAML